MPTPVVGVSREDLEDIAAFIENARELRLSRFVKDIVDRGGTISFTVGFDRDKPEVSQRWEGPEYEQVKAFVLTFRKFIQGNDRSALRNMAALVARLPVTDELKKNFLESRDNLNTHLDSGIAIGVNGTVPTHRDILYDFLYGWLSHDERDRWRRVRAWRSAGPVFGMLYSTFVAALSEVLACVTVLETLLLKMKDELAPASK